MEHDAVVVGSGPGGASAARELCRAGKRVIMLEYGSNSEWLGNHLSALYQIDLKSALPYGHPMLVRGITTGGSCALLVLSVLCIGRYAAARMLEKWS